jgi:hypothetical protein
VWSLFLFLAVGFRANSPAGDYANYRLLFESLQTNEWLKISITQGCVGFGALSHYIGHYQVLIALCAGISILSYVVFIHRHTKWPFFALFVFFGYLFYEFFIEQYRQGVAMAIVLWAIQQKKIKSRSILLIIMASLFHLTAIIALLIFFVPERIKKLNIYISAFVIVSMISLLLSNILSGHVHINTFSPYISDRYNLYLDRVIDKNFSVYFIPTGVVIKMFVFSIIYYYRIKISQFKETGYFLNLYFISLLIQKMFYFVPEFAWRESVYFSSVEIILVANMLFCLQGKIIGRILLILFIALSIYRQLYFILDFDSRQYTYELIF